jgi:hypothetical protein
VILAAATPSALAAKSATSTMALGAKSLEYKLPAIYQYRDFVAAGGAMSYGGDIEDTYYHAASTPGESSTARSRAISLCSFQHELSYL